MTVAPVVEVRCGRCTGRMQRTDEMIGRVSAHIVRVGGAESVLRPYGCAFCERVVFVEEPCAS